MDYINLPKEVFQLIANGDKTMFLYVPDIETSRNSLLQLLRIENVLTLQYRKRNSDEIASIGLVHDIFQLIKIVYEDIAEDVIPLIIKTTGVKAIRLNNISDIDCVKMGIKANFRPQSMTTKFYLPDYPECGYITPQIAFTKYINNTLGKGIWRKNPVVIMYEFELAKQ